MMASERIRAKYGLGLLADTLNPFWGGLFLGLLHSWNTCAVLSLSSWRHAAEADGRDACISAYTIRGEDTLWRDKIYLKHGPL